MMKTENREKPNSNSKNPENWTNIFKNQAVDFCLATGLHGYKYIVQSNRTKTERYIWGVIVMSSLCCSLIFMQIAWEYNTAHSTLTVIESTHHGVWNFPFPAVTVCNNNQVSLKKAQQFVNNLTVVRNLSRQFILREMRLLVELLDPGIFEHDIDSNLTLLQDIFIANKYTIPEVMKLVKQDCSSLLLVCKWRGNHTPCHELFEQNYSRDGLCCSFNYFYSKNQIYSNTEPQRLTACGYQTGLTFLVDAEPEDYFSSLYASYGVKVMVHDSYDYPVRSSEFKLVGLGVQAFLAISPEQTYSTAAVKELSIKKRECIFFGEKLPPNLNIMRQNSTWSKYSYVNCLNECRAYIILERCGCIPFFYVPRTGVKVCDLTDTKCLVEIRSVFDCSWPGTKIKSEDLPSSDIDIKNKPCNCLLDCSIYKYVLDSTQGILNRDKFYNAKILSPNTTEKSKNYSLINVFYTDLVSTQYRRDLYYNWKNLFASFGGLLGLFVGFSIMSAFELIYFFIVRVIADRCIRKKKKLSLKNFHYG